MWKELRGEKTRYFERFTDPKTCKRRRVSVTLEKKNDKKALSLLTERIKAETAKIGDHTLAQAAELYFRDISVTVSTATLKRNGHTMKQMLAILGGYNRIEKLTAGYIRARLIDSGKSARTCNEYIKRFGAFIRWAYRNDLISSTACVDKLEKFKDIPNRIRIQDKFLNGSELAALLEGMKDEGNRLVTEFLALSGLRIGEAIALNDDDILKYIHVNKSYSSISREITPGKTLAAVRDVFIQPELQDCIDRLRAFMTRRKAMIGIESELFLVGRSGGRFSYYAFNKYFKEQTARLGHPLSTHSLRHSHASLLMEQGYPLEAISRRLGHESSEITRKIYLHVTEGIKKRDAELLSSISLLPPSCPQDARGTSESPIK